jgi:hypothetical protein
VFIALTGIHATHKSGNSWIDNAAILAHAARAATQLAAVVAAGLPLTHIEAANEPNDLSAGHNYGTPEQIAYLCERLRVELNAVGLSAVQIVAPSNASFDTTWATYVEGIKADTEANSAVAAFSAHTYNIGMRTEAESIIDRPLWQTEAGAHQVDTNDLAFPRWTADMACAAARCINDLARGVAVWCYFLEHAPTEVAIFNRAHRAIAWADNGDPEYCGPFAALELLSTLRGKTVRQLTANTPPAGAVGNWQGGRKPRYYALVATSPGKVWVAICNYTSCNFADSPSGSRSFHVTNYPYYQRTLAATLNLGAIGVGSIAQTRVAGGENLAGGSVYTPETVTPSLVAGVLTLNVKPLQTVLIEMNAAAPFVVDTPFGEQGYASPIVSDTESGAYGTLPRTNSVHIAGALAAFDVAASTSDVGQALCAAGMQTWYASGQLHSYGSANIVDQTTTQVVGAGQTTICLIFDVNVSGRRTINGAEAAEFTYDIEADLDVLVGFSTTAPTNGTDILTIVEHVAATVTVGPASTVASGSTIIDVTYSYTYSFVTPGPGTYYVTLCPETVPLFRVTALPPFAEDPDAAVDATLYVRLQNAMIGAM